MAFVITGGCCNDASCVSVCPVDCIRPTPGDPDFMTTDQLYIDPKSCIDCRACAVECPVSAIHDDLLLPPRLEVFRDINAEYFTRFPLVRPQYDAPVTPPVRDQVLRVAVVGAGPAGLFAVEELLEAGAEVSLVEQLPTPFGLVRSGIAPDHLQTKQMSTQLQRVLDRDGVTCFFNVRFGDDLTLDDLRATHHAVIYAGGASDDRRLGIPGEELPGVMSAREFVSWYNGHPHSETTAPDLTAEGVVVIGNGNVAIDVARVLAVPVEGFRTTDMDDAAVDHLEASRVRRVTVTGRRGAMDAAYTTGELLALQHREDVDVIAYPDEVELVSPSSVHRFGAQRRLELAREAAKATAHRDRRRVELRFMLTPVSVNGTDRVESVTFRRTGAPDELVTIDAGLVLTAIGYRAVDVPGIPVNAATGAVDNERGRVTAEGVPPGVYVSGWVKRGATGVIGTNRADSAETVRTLLADHDAKEKVPPKPGADGVRDLLGAREHDVVTLDGWGRIDEEERARGRRGPVERPRQKLRHVVEMVRVATGAHDPDPTGRTSA